MILLTFLISCGTLGELGVGKAYSLDMTPPPGPPEYQKGWLHGCETGQNEFGSQFNRVFASAKQDPDMIDNPIYYRAWQDAHNYCRTFHMVANTYGLGGDSAGGWSFESSLGMR